MLSMSKLILKSGSTVYQNMLSVLLVSLVWSITLVPFLFILPWQTALIYMLVMAFPATLAVFGAMNEKLKNERTNIIAEYFKALKKFYLRGFLVGILISIIVLIPVSTWYMYVSTDGGYGMFLFSIAQTYLCTMFLLSQVYTVGFIVINDQPFVKSMNESMKTFVAKPTYTIAVFLQLLSVCLLLCLTVVGFFLLFIGMFAIFMINSISNIYAEKEQQLQAVEA